MTATENLLPDARRNAQRLLAELQLEREQLQLDRPSPEIVLGLRALENVIESAKKMAIALEGF